MPNSKNEILQSVSVLERFAEESNDANVVRGAYKLIKQIEEFVQQLPEERSRAYSRSENEEAGTATRKGKPGRKPGRKKGSTAKATANEASTGGKRRGRKPKNAAPVTQTSEAAE